MKIDDVNRSVAAWCTAAGIESTTLAVSLRCLVLSLLAEQREEDAKIVESHKDDHIVDWRGVGCPVITAEIRGIDHKALTDELIDNIKRVDAMPDKGAMAFCSSAGHHDGPCSKEKCGMECPHCGGNDHLDGCDTSIARQEVQDEFEPKP